jgi:hypothetical protein
LHQPMPEPKRHSVATESTPSAMCCEPVSASGRDRLSYGNCT